MRIAINIADISRVPPVISGMVLDPVIIKREIIEVEKGKMDGSAVVIDNADEARARSIVELFRMWDKRAKRYATRAYAEGKRGGWSKI